MAKIPTDDQYKVHTRLLPILELAIRGEIYKPFEKNSDLIDGKYLWDEREGLLPPEYEGEFSGRFSEFAVTAKGVAIDQVEPFIQDGITYAYMELEEPDDWPDLVLKLEDERRRVLMGTEYVPVKPY